MSTPQPGEHPFALDDGAYLLGALSPAERAAYEAHLQTCPSCAKAVTELAGLPGLLGRVSPEVAQEVARETIGDTDAAAPAQEPPPASLLAGLLDRVRVAQRRRRRRAALRAGAGALLAAVLVTVVLLRPGDDQQPPAPPIEAVALLPVAEVPMAVTARLQPVAWGTRIELTCTYDGAAASAYSAPPVYTLVVEDTGGRAEQVASWRAVPGREVTVEAATALRRGQISRLEVRGPGDRPVLEVGSL